MNDNQTLYYLKEQVYFEPLFNQWYAWPYLIPPVTGARHMTNTHKRIMKSFINNYKLHIMAVNQPGMAGAEFLNCSESQVEDIKGLVARIDEEHADLVALSEAVRELDDLLRNHTSGESIESLYPLVPEPLKGYVELFMDMNHHPAYRVIESLVYRSPYYKPSLQTVSFGSLDRIAERPFILSTPRLPDDDHIQVQVDYNADFLKKVLAARDVPLTKAQIDELFANETVSGGLDYMELFTTEAQSKYHHVPVINGVRVEYIGHAGYLVETADVAILIDPVIASRSPKYADEIISFNQLPEKIDYILLTHNHQDHVSFETLLQLRHKTDTVVVPKNNGGTLPDPSLRLLLKQFEFNVIEVDDLDEIALPGGHILSIPFLGEHGDLFIRSKTAWYIELMGKKLFFGADSSNLEPRMYQHIHGVIGDLDVLAIGMECIGAPYTWLYGALTTKLVSKNIKESRRLNGASFEQAYHMVETFKPKEVKIYALGMEPWYKYFMGIEYDDHSEQIVESQKMLDRCDENAIPAKRMFGKETVTFA